MMPTVVIIGRPNVGKSALFNRLAGRRIAIVEGTPGLTRDRLECQVSWRGRTFRLVDTGGIGLDEVPLADALAAQAQRGISRADVLIFLVDAKAGLTPLDREIADMLRRAGKPVVVGANKIDSPSELSRAGEFYALGLGDPLPVSALHGLGTGDLLDRVVALLPERGDLQPRPAPEPIRLAIVGKPNVGKSSIVNRLVGEERVIVHEKPGTTVDAVDVLVRRPEGEFLLIDTAGLRRPRKISAFPERLAVLRALTAVRRSQVSCLVLDATEPVTAQDRRIAGYILRSGRGAVIAANKWDLVSEDGEVVRAGILADLDFLSFAPLITTSALTGEGIDHLMRTVSRVAEEYARRVPTSDINRAIQRAVGQLAGRGGLRVYYATQVSTSPPTIVVFVNDPSMVKDWFTRYLQRTLREEFGFQGTPIRLIFRRRRR